MNATEAPTALDVSRLRGDFPILSARAGDKPLVYLDNAATSQKPQAVLEAVDVFFRTSNANIHRGVHYLSVKATDQFEESRRTVQLFLNAIAPEEIIFTKGCTEAINLVANGLLRSQHDDLRLKQGDEILLSTMEHHANIVSWQLVAAERGAVIKVIPITDDGEIILEEYEKLLSERTKVVGVVHVSNSLGTINPVKQMIQMARRVGAKVLLDGAQGGPHRRIDVLDLDCDFYTLSCHKMYAPTGVGVLYGKKELLEKLAPYQGGGDMIKTVSFEKSTFAGLPNKFEPGTPNVGGIIGLAAAIRYIESLAPVPESRFKTQTLMSEDVVKANARVIAEESRALGFDNTLDTRDSLTAAFDLIGRHERELTQYASERLLEIPGVRILGPKREKAGIVSFVMDGVHPHDIGTILDSEGVAVRAGHHCCMPLMTRLGIPATARASFALYNTKEEADALAAAVRKVKETFA